MPRAATTLDAFNAIAEPKRRAVLNALAKGERWVNELTDSLGWPQPQVSKHLAVLKKVGLVSMRRQGRHKVYAVNAAQLEPIYAWVKTFERFWDHQLDQIKKRAEAKKKERIADQSHQPK
jgi:DNA-binding transcriptional ArsR family regulator